MLARLRAVAHHLAPSHSAARMSTTIHNDNAACCSIPPVRSDYTPKGSYKSYAGFTKVGGISLISEYLLTNFCAGRSMSPVQPLQAMSHLSASTTSSGVSSAHHDVSPRVMLKRAP